MCTPTTPLNVLSRAMSSLACGCNFILNYVLFSVCFWYLKSPLAFPHFNSKIKQTWFQSEISSFPPADFLSPYCNFGYYNTASLIQGTWGGIFSVLITMLGKPDSNDSYFQGVYNLTVCLGEEDGKKLNTQYKVINSYHETHKWKKHVKSSDWSLCRDNQNPMVIAADISIPTSWK